MKAAFLLFSIFVLLPNLAAAQRSEHEFGMGLRLRAGFAGDLPEASSYSARATSSWRAIWSGNWASHIQASATAADNSHYFDGVTDNGFAKIPDSDGANITEGNIRYRSLGSEIVLGRQVLHLLGGRLIGNNGFWQKPQVFDAFSVEKAFGGQFEISASYFWQANRIGGRQANHELHRDDIRFQLLNGKRQANELGEHTLNSWMLEGIWRQSGNTVKLIALEHENQNLDVHDNSTRGLSAQHLSKVGRWRLNAVATALLQERLNLSIPYYDLQLSIKRQPLSFQLQRETLGSREGTAFITPLASLHDFQGMTDQFLITPASGIHDNNISVSYRTKLLGAVTAKAHYFERYSGQVLGQELSVEWGKAFDRQLEMNLRAAQFERSDARKIWKVFITIEQKFGQM